MEDVAPAKKPSQRVEEAKAKKAEADALLDEIDAILDEGTIGEVEAARRAFKEKIASLSLGPRHCCGACSDCPYGYRS
jgi:soluble cytochrome b562